MQILAALFVESIEMRQIPGPATRIDLGGVMFSLPAPSEPPVTVAPHLVVIVACGADETGTDVLEVVFRDEAGEQVARSAQPLQVEPGKFGRQLVRGELTYESYGTISAHCRTSKGEPVVVPLTLLPAPRPDMPFAAALSEHPVTAYATGEVCGAVLERLGPHPDVAIVIVSLAHAGALEDVMGTVTSILHPSVTLGAAASAVVGTGREVEDGAAVSLWAAQVGPVVPLRIGPSLDGIPASVAFEPGAAVVFADPFSVSAPELLEALGGALGRDVPIVGGLVAGARGPGGTRIAVGDRVWADGAVGVILGPGVAAQPVVSQGCRPVGRPFVVTDASGPILRSLGGRTAIERLDELAGSLSPEEVKAVNAGGLHMGLVLDERKADFEPGDFLVRAVLGGDRSTGAIAVGDSVDVGTTVQFHIRDAAAADDDLDRLLAGVDVAPEGALLFTCTGRGAGLFGVADHDAGAVASRWGAVPTAGFFSAGEIGPVAGRNEVHSFTASMLLLRGSPGSDSGGGPHG